VVWERAYAGTADFRRDEGEDIDDTRFVAGLRFWF
jgi:copper resistance protein B